MPVYSSDKRLKDVELPPFAEKINEEFNDNDEYDENINYDKTKVECICPKCGRRHVVNFHWVGRGTPRKFCPLCKNLI